MEDLQTDETSSNFSKFDEINCFYILFVAIIVKDGIINNGEDLQRVKLILNFNSNSYCNIQDHGH